ncbi:hypothetical protein CRG98_040993 [Punica granatum]|uniref:Uncharacterized protein n=1 Tax=Punica granatum TaxID=22663 RepID=A0A2I0I4D5_PUNGR|nr:hypothetical protein CRG98_040993 [Punica granatum]
MGCRWAGPMRGRTGPGWIPAECAAGGPGWATGLGRKAGPGRWLELDRGGVPVQPANGGAPVSGLGELWASKRINELRVYEFQPLQTRATGVLF